MTNPLLSDPNQLEHLGHLLMAAASIDGGVAQDEVDAIVNVLGELAPQTPGKDARQKIAHFDPNNFDLKTTCDALALPNKQARITVLTALARITNADDMHTHHEDAFIRRVATAIGAHPDEYENLTVDFNDIFADKDNNDFF